LLSFNQLISDIEKSLEAMTEWLRQPGLKVNIEKTEVCLFYINDTQPVLLNVSNSIITSKSEINVLGVKFDSKLNWVPQVLNALKKASRP
jgi:hypothetical protein